MEIAIFIATTFSEPEKVRDDLTINRLPATMPDYFHVFPQVYLTSELWQALPYVQPQPLGNNTSPLYPPSTVPSPSTKFLWTGRANHPYKALVPITPSSQSQCHGLSFDRRVPVLRWNADLNCNHWFGFSDTVTHNQTRSKRTLVFVGRPTEVASDFVAPNQPSNPPRSFGIPKVTGRFPKPVSEFGQSLAGDLVGRLWFFREVEKKKIPVMHPQIPKESGATYQPGKQPPVYREGYIFQVTYAGHRIPAGVTDGVLFSITEWTDTIIHTSPQPKIFSTHNMSEIGRALVQVWEDDSKVFPQPADKKLTATKTRFSKADHNVRPDNHRSDVPVVGAHSVFQPLEPLDLGCLSLRDYECVDTPEMAAKKFQAQSILRRLFEFSSSEFSVTDTTIPASWSLGRHFQVRVASQSPQFPEPAPTCQSGEIPLNEVNGK